MSPLAKSKSKPTSGQHVALIQDVLRVKIRTMQRGPQDTSRALKRLISDTVPIFTGRSFFDARLLSLYWPVKILELPNSRPRLTKLLFHEEVGPRNHPTSRALVGQGLLDQHGRMDPDWFKLIGVGAVNRNRFWLKIIKIY